ncbi:ParA family protein [Dickeya dadantii]|uniref:ParA family protein n=1 Tax=Dickeya dadantii TaxID=204038 RepID=UPI001495C948|nr:ParA family protein [Dickeya dadantii]NPE57497.1 ParA family protein [Dickeya dadantii]NPE68967.1 ParA family protein [Dickeya dadantii]
MATITVAGQKGGIGKSLLSVTLTQYLSEKKGRRCLFVPLDNQGGTAKRAFSLKPVRPVNGMFTGDDYDIQHVTDLIDSLYSDRLIHNIDKLDTSSSQLFVSEISKLKPFYDDIIIDTPPGVCPRITAAILAADKIVVPIECEISAVEGMIELNDTIKKLAFINTKAKINAIVINKYKPTVRQKKYLNYLIGKFKSEVITETIGDLEPIRTKSGAGIPIWKHAKTGNERHASKVVQTVMSRIVEMVI